MSIFTYADAINAGLKTELMTVVILPDTDTVITPTVLSGTYKLGTTDDNNGKFNGYALIVNQDPLTATSISGEFIDTENFLDFAKDLKDSGATLQLVDDFSESVTKFTAPNAKAQGLIYDIRHGDTTVEGRFEISEGVITIYQKPFKLIHEGGFTYGAFSTADDLIEFVEKCLEDLKMFDQVKRMWFRKPYRYLERFSGIARLSDKI